MVPSNPSNGQPLIFRILDSLGVAHIVACFNHTHDKSEVDGLVASLNGKQNTLTFDDAPTNGSNNPVKSGGIFTAIANAVANKLAKLTSFTTGNFVRVKSDGTLEDSGKKASDFANADDTSIALAGKADKVSGSTNGNFASLDNSGNLLDSGKKASDFALKNLLGDENDAYVLLEDSEVEIFGEKVDIYVPKTGGGTEHVSIDEDNIDNLQRALQNPDQSPTSNSDNLVTSGGVKSALDDVLTTRFITAQSSAKPLIEDIFVDVNLQKVDCGILNLTGSEASITDLFSISVGQTLVLPDNATPIQNGKMVLLHIYRSLRQGYFFVSIGGIFSIE